MPSKDRTQGFKRRENVEVPVRTMTNQRIPSREARKGPPKTLVPSFVAGMSIPTQTAALNLKLGGGLLMTRFQREALTPMPTGLRKSLSNLIPIRKTEMAIRTVNQTFLMHFPAQPL